MVCLSARGPDGAGLLRYGPRLAGRLNSNRHAFYVQRPSESPAAIDVATQRYLSDTLKRTELKVTCGACFFSRLNLGEMVE